MSEYNRAVDCYRRAIELCRSLGAAFQEAEMLAALADVHHDAGDPALAEECLRRALEILERIGQDATEVRARLREGRSAAH